MPEKTGLFERPLQRLERMWRSVHSHHHVLTALRNRADHHGRALGVGRDLPGTRCRAGSRSDHRAVAANGHHLSTLGDGPAPTRSCRQAPLRSRWPQLQPRSEGPRRWPPLASARKSSSNSPLQGAGRTDPQSADGMVHVVITSSVRPRCCAACAASAMPVPSPQTRRSQQ